jgi:hypothetical protein
MDASVREGSPEPNRSLPVVQVSHRSFEAKPMDRLSAQASDCIRILHHCHAVCLSAAMIRFLEDHDLRNRPQHIRLLTDSGAACSFAADLIAHKSQFHTQACALAADVCETCAKDCEQLGGLEDCARACRAAASSARAMSRPERAGILGMASRLPPNP